MKTIGGNAVKCNQLLGYHSMMPGSVIEIECRRCNTLQRFEVRN